MMTRWCATCLRSRFIHAAFPAPFRGVACHPCEQPEQWQKPKTRNGTLSPEPPPPTRFPAFISLAHQASITDDARPTRTLSRLLPTHYSLPGDIRLCPLMFVSIAQPASHCMPAPTRG